MDTYEAKVLMEDSVRCLARMMEQIRLREIGKVAGDDEPMQDHLAQCVSPVPPYEEMSFEDCIEYLKDLHDGFKEASDHEIKMERTFSPSEIELGLICDMVMGFIGHGFPDELIACAQEIKNLVPARLPAKDLYAKSDTMCDHVVAHLLKEAEKIIKKHGYKTWADGNYSLPLGYLSTWFRKQYWGY